MVMVLAMVEVMVMMMMMTGVVSFCLFSGPLHGALSLASQPPTRQRLTRAEAELCGTVACWLKWRPCCEE